MGLVSSGCFFSTSTKIGRQFAIPPDHRGPMGMGEGGWMEHSDIPMTGVLSISPPCAP